MADFIPTILALSEGADRNLQSSLIVYTFVSSDLKEEQLMAIVASLPVAIKKNVMTTLDVFVEKGRQEGEQIGLQKGLQKGLKEGLQKGLKEKAEKGVRNLLKVSALNDEQIASAMEVPVDYVIRLRQEQASGDQER